MKHPFTSTALCSMPASPPICSLAVMLSLSLLASAAEVTKDIEYARVGELALKLDLHLPATSDRSAPLLVYVHGGAWREGSKADVPIAKLVQQGFAIASVDYRLSTVAPFPAQIHDLKAAVRFLRAQATVLHVDSQRIGIIGSSAGGHLAALVGVTNGHAELEGTVGDHLDQSSKVQAIVSLYGASNLQTILGQSTEFGLKMRVPALQLLLGGQPTEKPALAKLASPVAHLDAADPPLMLVHGDADPQMPFQQAEEFSAAYAAHQLSVKFVALPGGKHGDPRCYDETHLQLMAEFLRAHLMVGADPAWLTTGEFQWKCSAPLLGADSQAAEPEVALKDPSFVRVDDQWHLFATHRLQNGVVNLQQLNFKDWHGAAATPRSTLALHDQQYHCAPQVFYFTPHKLWYLIFQLADANRPLKFGPFFSTTKTIADPTSWSKPQPMIVEPLTGTRRPRWIDFWVICDDTQAHLFYTSDDGYFWRCETPKASFPLGWSRPQLALEDTHDELFEASHTYKLKGRDQYLTLIEAIGDRCRYYKAWLAPRLAGPWQPLATTREKPFAAAGNIAQDHAWTDNVSHGELVRSSNDEHLEVDPAHLQFVFQGASHEEYRGQKYGGIPWRLGMLELKAGPP